MRPALPIDPPLYEAAFLLLTGPWALIVTVLLTDLGEQGRAWPWVLGILPAVVGGATGALAVALLGRAAIARLRTHEVAIIELLVAARS